MASRPKRGDTEDDLLEFQEQFLASRNNPSAAVVRVNKDARDRQEQHSAVQRDVVDLQGLPQSLAAPIGDFGPPKKKSKFREKRISKMKGKVDSDFTNGKEEDTAELLDSHDTHVSTVLTEIRERDIHQSQVIMPNRILGKGFPEALHRGQITKNQQECNTSNDSKRSLFAQHFRAAKPSVFGLPQVDLQNNPPSDKQSPTNSDVTKQKSQGGSFSSPRLVSGKGLISSSVGDQQSVASREVENIHKENVERLSALSKEEILQEQERIMKSLDPGLLSFLKLHHQKKTSQATNSSQQEAKMETEDHHTSTQLTGLENKIKIDSSITDVSLQTCESMDVQTQDNKHVHFDDNIEVRKQDKTLKDKVVEVDKLTKMAAEQKWVHMDTVEKEKLEWMKDCPAPSAVKKESNHQARFAFDGSLITRNADIPVNVGLHHHGDEPEAAGYTLEELFVLSRSSFLQQRVVALQTLARIIVQDTQGAFTDQLQCSVLSTLLDAGIIFLLRWAMDDTADAVIAVAIQCLAAVLVVPSDQDCCDRVCEWYRGQELPSLRPEVEEKNENESESESEDEERRHETDAEVVKKDVIKGLLQMRVLPRLRYILEVCRPSPTTVRAIFSILTRIAKHSTGASHEIVKCPRMLESVFSKFLPTSWRRVDVCLNDVEDMYGLPAPEALILLRTICTSGRHLSSLLISKYNLISYILCYISLHPQDIQLSFEDGMNLCIESIRTWTVCISYGLACDQFRETFPNLLQHLQKLQDLSIVKQSSSASSLEKECRRACALLNLLEHVIHVAGTSAEMHAKMLASSPNANRETEADCLPPPPVNWSHVMGFIPLVSFALNKWKNEIVSLEENHLDSDLDCHVLRCTSMCNLLASFYSKLPSQPSFSPVDSLQDIEDLVSSILLPVINSAFLGSMIRRLRNVSTSPSAVLFTRGTPNLPDYGTLPANSGCKTTEPTQPLLHGPAVAFITSLTRLLCSVINVHKGIADKFLPLVMKEEIIDYIQSISSTQEILSQSYFGRFELHMQYFLIKLFYLVVRSVDCKDMSSPLAVYHSAALVVFSRLRAGDEYYAHDLMSTILFNPEFYPEAKDQTTTSVARDLSELNITAKGVPSQPLLTKENRNHTQRELLCEAHKNLLGIRSTYMSSFGKVRHALAASRSLALHQPHDIQSLLLSPSRGPFLPADWMFVPVIDLHNQTLSAENKGGALDEVPPAMISTVTCTLQMILMLEEWRPVSLSSVSMVAKITRLMCIFLTGSDLFLDRLVHHYVRSLLLIYTRPSYLSRLDFSGNVAGLSSFYDLYTSLLTHYSAVSFGDPLFASFLVLPLAQRHDVKFRRALWDEFVGTIRAVSFSVKQVPLPLDNFLYPIEQDDVLLYLYLRALANQDARPRWCPFFYLLAVHHVNAFIYQRIDPKDTLLLKRKLSLLNHVMQVKLQDVRNDILYYYKPLPDSSSDKAFEVFSSLPADREILLRNRQDIEECRMLYEKMAK